ncbi:MAG: endonuclease MutS2 [Ruminococcaceae bacterium]|nr:endonuclease MutS2 [Oscillospiraceae bacterium]
MNLFEKSVITLELPRVLEKLCEYAASEGAKEILAKLAPLPHIDDMRRSMKETDDAISLMGTRAAPGFSGLKDVTGSVKRAERGGSLTPVELLRIAAFLRTARDTRAWLSEDRRVEIRTTLDPYFDAINANKFLEEHISGCIISEEEIADSASAELAAIRRQIRAANARVREVLHRIITSPSYSKMLQENIVTIRGDRYVVPVKIENKGAFGGLVHDVSASGQTVYIEPTQVVEANNELRLLAAKEQKEIERILAQLSEEVASFAGGIIDDYKILTELDCIFARARYALAIDAQAPAMAEDGATDLRRARHPLLPQKTAVPIDIRIGTGFDTLVITGPNTGGKTVALKTIGLLTLMAMCGLHIPAEYDSRVSTFSSIFADIGDEQSISQSLSTFSSHMVNIVGILGELDDRSLVLFDELGAGTDPVEGAALAMSIIENIRRRGARVVATTHYAELKSYALTEAGVENAACEFDLATLRPTYRLLIGVPGKSNAFAISARLGLSEDIIEEARANLASSDVKFEDVLTKLEQERQAMENEREAARAIRREAEEERKKSQQMMQELNRDREKELAAARKSAQKLVDDARAASDAVFEEIARLRKAAASNAFSDNLVEARASMGRMLNEVQSDAKPKKEPKKIVQHRRPLKAGDTVELLSTGNRATVLSAPDKNGKLRLQAGIMQLTLHQSDVQLVEELPPEPKKDAPPVRMQVASRSRNASMEVDLRGMNADEGIIEMERFLDSASMASLPSVTIIHGKGTGILRAAVHDALKKDKRVKSYRLGKYGEGENGVTIVEFK